LNWRREAIIRSIDLLQPNDRAGVNIVRLGAGYWIPRTFQDVQDRPQRWNGWWQPLRASGGTDYSRRHDTGSAGRLALIPQRGSTVSLMTDGGADPTRLVEIGKS